jgi:two-component system, OmpR family, response regulator
LRILVVEDEPKMADILRRGLQEEGYAVDTTGEGEEAIWMANENDYDGIVLDVMIPGPDGIEVCRRLREESVWSPILMLTARAAIRDRVRGLDVGADDYLIKPFSFEELLARLRALLRRGPVERPAQLEVADLVLDPATRRVERAGKEIALTPKEFALLEFLMRHPDEVLTRSRIREHVWDWGFDGASNVVDVYVRYLRQKIDVTSDSSLIRTVRGVGYSISAR